jgi:dolichyl-phosphate-mannose-protein mannosyltransferase
MATDTAHRPDARGSARSSGSTSARRRWHHAAWVVPLALLLVAAGLRFYRLGEPDRIYFDEVYYTQDGADLLDRGVEEGFVVHPPVGKWVIAAGIATLGDGPVGWRAGMAVAGSLTVVMTYLVGLRLFRRRGLAALAAFLVTVDGLAFTMSRIAMLDALLALFVLTAFWLLLLDRDEQWSQVPPADTAEAGSPPEEPPPLPRRPHRFRWLAGAVLGLAIATKWSGVLAIGGAGLLVLGSELAFRRRVTGRWMTAWPRLVTSVLLTLVAVPALVYVLSYAGWFANHELTRPGSQRCTDPTAACVVPLPTMVADWAEEQRQIAAFHGDLTATHRYRAPARSWPLLQRPVAYFYESCTERARQEQALAGEECAVADDHVAEILGLGNPALWWLALLAYPFLAWAAVVRRSWAAGAIGVFLLAQYLPWLLASRPLFLFYMTPVVPFMALGLACAAGAVSRHPLTRWIPAAVAVLALAAFAFWYPVLSGVELPEGAWRARMWLDTWI